jgi:DNA-binding CsgD family transcriptional regulator
MGIALLNGGRTIDFSVLGKIASGWVATPVIAGLISFIALFFMSNVFNLTVTQKQTHNIIKERNITPEIQSPTPENTKVISSITKTETETEQNTIKLSHASLIAGIIVLLLIILYLLWNNRKLKIHIKQNDYNEQILKYNEQQAKLEFDLKITNNQNARLEAAIKTKKKAQRRIALDIIQKNEVLNRLKTEIDLIKQKPENEIKYTDLNNIKILINEQLNIEKERKSLYNYIKELNSNFYKNLEKKFPTLTKKEKRLCALLRLNLSSKEIASILGISFKSVEVNRYRLRKKMNLKKNEKLSNTINKL